MFRSLCVVLMLCASTIADCSSSSYPEYNFNLGGHNLKWPCESTKNIYTQTGRYVPRNVIPTRGQIAKELLLVAMPRLKTGIPFTLGQVLLKKGECQSQISPFPSWPTQEEGNCQALQSVVDLALDKHGVVWVLDTGLVNTLEQPIRRCPPKVIAIKVATGKIVKQIDLSHLVMANSLLQFILVEHSSSGNPFVYVSDAKGGSILVYNVAAETSHRIVLPKACKSEKNEVLYMALATSQNETADSHKRSLYFTYLGSTELYAIDTKHLRNGSGSGSVIHVGSKPHGLPCILLGSNGKNRLLLRIKGQNDIYSWKTSDCFKMSNLIEVNAGGECRLSTQVITGNNNYLWSLESNFQDYINGTTGCNGASVKLFPFTIETKK